MKVTICTVLVCNYDYLGPVCKQFQSRKDWRFICYSDVPLTVDGWNSRPIPTEVGHLSPFLQTRYIKLFCQSLENEPGLYVYVDSNLDLLSQFSELVHLFVSSSAPLGFIRHPERTSVAEELKALSESNKIIGRKELLTAQINYYREVSRSIENEPLFENSIIFKLSEDSAVDRLMNDWWIELKTWSTRDQISLPYVLSQLEPNYFCFIINLRKKVGFVRYRGHRSASFQDIHAFLHARSGSKLFRLMLTIWQPFHNILVRLTR